LICHQLHQYYFNFSWQTLDDSYWNTNRPTPRYQA